MYSFNMEAIITILIIITISLILLKWKTGTKQLLPGPPGLPIIGNLLDFLFAKNSGILVQQWAETYGKIFMFTIVGRVTIVLNDLDLIMKALHHPQMQGRSEIITSRKAFGPGDGITDNSGEPWKVHRIFTLGVFRSFGVGRSVFESVVINEGKFLVKNLVLCKRSDTELTGLLAKASCNMISGIVFGRRRDYEDPELDVHQENIRKYFSLGGPGGIFHFSEFSCNLPFGPSKRAIDVKKCLRKYYEKEILEHKARVEKSNDHSGNDFLHKYLQKIEKLPGDKIFCEKNLIRLLDDFYLAGTETVATTMTWAILLFMMYPDVQKMCRDEVDSVLGRQYDVQLSDRTSLPFIMAAIEEIQRIGCVAPFASPHKVEADVELGGYYFLQGSEFFPNVLGICQNEAIWKNPYEFKPSRHLDDNGKFIKPAGILAFGSGKRTCIGEELAKMELFIWIATILQNLEIKRPQDYEPPDIRIGVGAFTRNPLPYRVIIEPRPEGIGN